MVNFDAIVIGDAKLDTFLTINENNPKCRLDDKTKELCFKHGEKISVEHTYFSLGGNAANVAVGLSRLELNVAIAAEIGDDEFALKISNALSKEKIDRRFIHQATNQESSMSVIINFKGDRTIFSEHVHRKHNFHYHDSKAKWLYLTSLGEEWVPAYERALNYTKENNALLAFNPGTLQLAKKHDVIKKVLQNTAILLVNKEEAGLLLSEYANIKNPPENTKDLLYQTKHLGPKTVIITNGKHGSFAIDDKEKYYKAENFPVKIRERTGAGDAYSSGFLGATILGLPIQLAMKWGSMNSASVIEGIGAEAGLLRKQEMETKINEL